MIEIVCPMLAWQKFGKENSESTGLKKEIN
jgi:hypothetical protein